MKNEFFYSDDYIGSENEKYNFYYGYEVTHCKKHKTEQECDDKDCDEREWCFTARNAVNNNLLLKLTTSELEKFKTNKWGGDSMSMYLITGINHFFNKFNESNMHI